MTREEALQALESPSMHVRLGGARYFMREAASADFSALNTALAVESVVWVRTALQSAIDRVSGGYANRSISTAQVWEEAEPEDEAYAQAVEDTTRRLVHEIEPIVGSLRLHARMELPNFDDSRTRRGLDRLIDTLSAISALGKVAAVPHVREFDLAELIMSVSEAESTGKTGRVELAGIRPLITMGDPTIVAVVVANGIRNALEATAAGSRKDQPVIVNWGSTPAESWVTVLDSGIGLPLRVSRVYEIGSTTKTDHLGMGLAICYRAARTLGGQLVLKRRDDVGVSFEFRWPRPFTER